MHFVEWYIFVFSLKFKKRHIMNIVSLPVGEEYETNKTDKLIGHLFLWCSSPRNTV